MQKKEDKLAILKVFYVSKYRRYAVAESICEKSDVDSHALLARYLINQVKNVCDLVNKRLSWLHNVTVFAGS